MNIAVFASGSGSNAQKIFEHFQGRLTHKVVLLVCNKPDALVIERAKKFSIPVVLIDKESFKNQVFILEQLRQHSVDFIVLAGFLWLIPAYLTQQYAAKIVNIHPALLPKYGGKGMHGMYVHQAVYDNKEKESGITIHYVNEVYDSGKIIFQAKCSVEGLLPEQIAAEVLKLEHKYFAEVIEQILS